MVLKNIKIVDFDGEYVSDIQIKDKIIEKIAPNIDAKDAIDAEGNYLFPKLIDIGTTFSGSNFQTLPRVVQKAKKSGVGVIVSSSKTSPMINNETALESLQLKSSFEEISIMPMINSKKGEGLSDMATLLNKGGVAIEIDSDYDLNLIARAFEYAKLKNVPIVCNANSKSLQGEGMVAEGEVSNKLGIVGVSTLCESVEVVKIAHMADFYGVDVLFLHLSTHQGIKLSRNCFVSSSIHHILNDATACLNFNTKAKIYPPLRQKLEDCLDKIDIITSMHSKVTSSNKDLAFAEASYGIDSLEEFLPLCYSLVLENKLSMVELIQKICYNPAKLFSIDNQIKEGAKFDAIIFNPSVEFIVDKSESLYEGKKLHGAIKHYNF